MNKQIEEKKKLFEDAWKVRTDFEEEDFKLRQRAEQAKKDIIKLQEETEKLKEKRPALLADNKDVKKLNKRLKDIEEEIEINNDLITGITAKRRRVKGRFIKLNIVKETTILIPAIKNSSGQWWANSVTSNKSLVIRDIIVPTLVLS